MQSELPEFYLVIVLNIHFSQYQLFVSSYFKEVRDSELARISSMSPQKNYSHFGLQNQMLGFVDLVQSVNFSSMLDSINLNCLLNQKKFEFNIEFLQFSLNLHFEKCLFDLKSDLVSYLFMLKSNSNFNLLQYCSRKSNYSIARNLPKQFKGCCIIQFKN